MPKVNAKIAMNYDLQGSGEPLILIPFIAADHACYAFQVAEFSRHFTCISVDLRGTGETEAVPGAYSLADIADDVAEFMRAIGVARAHIFGLSFGAGVALMMGIRHPENVLSLSVHGAWTKTDLFLSTLVKGWQTMARALGSVPEVVIQSIFPWCLTSELYASKPEYIQSLADFVRSRPAQSLESFLQQTNAVLAFDIESDLARIKAPTQITLGQYDMMTSLRFANRIKAAVPRSELVVFEGCAHAPLFEKVPEFNDAVLRFLKRSAKASAA